MMRCDRSPSPRCRHYAGILVLTPPAALEECRQQLEPWVEVHRVEAKTGKIIVVLETSSLDEQERLLRRVRESAHVLLAELVYYRRDSESADESAFFDEDHDIGKAGA